MKNKSILSKLWYLLKIFEPLAKFFKRHPFKPIIAILIVWFLYEVLMYAAV